MWVRPPPALLPYTGVLAKNTPVYAGRRACDLQAFRFKNRMRAVCVQFDGISLFLKLVQYQQNPPFLPESE